MMRWTLVIIVGVFACTARTNPGPARPDSTLYRVIRGADTTTVSLFAVDGMPRPENRPTALARWTADIAPVDSGGECRLSRTAGSGATSVTAAFPAINDARTTIHLSFDSAGRLIRYLERRGGVHNVTISARNTTQRQRDSMLAALIVSRRATSISLDFAMDRGTAVNHGGGVPGTSVSGIVRDMENAEQFGPPKARIARARRLCGV